MSEIALTMLEHIRQRNYASMMELEQVCTARGVAPHGDLAITLSNVGDRYANVWLWAGVSEAFADALDEIRPWTEIKSAPCLVYVIDGGCLSLPLVKRVPKQGYEKPHWLPVVLRLRSPAIGAEKNSIHRSDQPGTRLLPRKDHAHALSLR